MELKLVILRGLLKDSLQRGSIILVACVASCGGICIQAAELQTPLMDRIIVSHGTGLALLVVDFNFACLVFIVFDDFVCLIIIIAVLAVQLKHSGTFGDVSMADGVLVLVWVLADAIAALSVTGAGN